MTADERPVPRTLLCVCNFPSNTGFAWDFIERLYAGVADRLAPAGVRTLVAYPEIVEAPRSLAGSAAIAVRCRAQPTVGRSLLALLALIVRERVQVVYFTDVNATSLTYPLLRLCGIRYVIVHDHTSGTRTPARGVKRTIKALLARLPGVSADRVIAVSDYVARRQRDVGQVAPARITRVWNGVPIAPPTGDPTLLRRELGIADGVPIVACCCRAHPVKGVAHLLRAFDRVQRTAAVRSALVYIGDGPQLGELRALAASLDSASDIRFTGYLPNARAYLQGADVCVSPSTWQEAFGLAVLEPMSLGKAVVATAVGGVPEILEDEVSGLLVPPADEDALADALGRLLADPALRARLGAAARARAASHFDIELQVRRLSELVAEGFALEPRQAGSSPAAAGARGAAS